MNEPLLKELEKYLSANNLEYRADSEEQIYAITWKSKLELTCLSCGDTFTISVKQLLRPHPERIGKVCPRCNSEHVFIEKLKETYGRNPYIFLTPFIGYNEMLKVECIDCGTEKTVRSARNLLMTINGSHPCKKCASNRNFKRDITELEEKIKDKLGVCNYEFNDPENYTGLYSKKKISVKCKKCDSIFTVAPQNLFNPRNGKHYCKNCNYKKLK